MKIAIIGNGILGLTTAYKLIKRDSGITVSIIGPADNKGCASLAAAAMFNSFCEIDEGTLKNEFEKQKFEFNKSATPFWPEFLKELSAESGLEINSGFGTYLINNHATDQLEDENFDAVIDALTLYGEKYENVIPSEIPNYSPSPQGRAARAIFINGEGWVNPIQLIEALKKYLSLSKRVQFIDNYCEKITVENNVVKEVVFNNGEKETADMFFLSPGATFSKIINASGIDLPFPKIFYGVGCSILFKTSEMTLKNCVRTPNRGFACGIYAAPQDTTHTLIGASNLIMPEPEDHARATSVYTILKSAMEQINTDYYRAQFVRSNVGWRPTSEDTLPLLGKTSITNLFVATGTKRDGLHCSPVISDYISDLILHGKSEYDFTFYTPERAPVRIYTREEAIRIAVRHTINAAYQHDFVSAKNRMVDDLTNYYTKDLETLHDMVGAHTWGIPPEMINMYRYGHAS